MHNSTEAHHAVPSDFAGWWNAPGDWVEEPNQRRNGWSGMMRQTIGAQMYYIKKQCNHLCRSLGHPMGWPTASREYENILRLQALGLHTAEPVFHANRRNSQGFEAVLVTKELAGFTALDCQTNLEESAREVLAREVGRVLGIMHRARLQHSCLYDKHIMVRWADGRPDIALIDLEKLRRPLMPWRVAKHDLNQLKRHQFIWSESQWKLLLESHASSMASLRPNDERINDCA